jgi:hypothetical protein
MWLHFSLYKFNGENTNNSNPASHKQGKIHYCSPYIAIDTLYILVKGWPPTSGVLDRLPGTCTS